VEQTIGMDMQTEAACLLDIMFGGCSSLVCRHCWHDITSLN